jgi:glycosyltransferase involved in cell wall biosynthesis
MSIYYKEKAQYFDRAMQSIWDEQSVKPNEIVLVEDGKLTDELYEVIGKWKEKLGSVLKIIPLEKNMGTGEAKNTGLHKCSYDLVAVMDTDDIAQKDRFKKQLKVFENSDTDVCSSWVSEFDREENKIVSYRKLPETHYEIVSFAKKRMPVNHPATMYKKDLALMVGGYKHMLWFEDYYLMVRMMLNGAKFYNIQEPLVNMRAGYGQLERRSGWKYAVEEWRFQKKILEIGFLTLPEFMRNASLRLVARILPKQAVKAIYQKIRD